MPEPEKDKEEQMREGEDLRRLTESKEWGLVSDIFWKHMDDLQSIMNVDPSQDLEMEIKARRIALEYMKDFWEDVTGARQQHEMNLYNETQGQKPENNSYSNTDSFIDRNA